MKETTETRRPIDGTFPPSFTYQYTYDTILAAYRIPAGCVNEQSHKLGMKHGEPLIVMLDCLLKYASVYNARNGGSLSDDYVLGPAWRNAAVAVRSLLDGDGSVAAMRYITTDSKDNGACEEVYMAAMKIAGYNTDTGDAIKD